jgi:peptidoglycan/xylan/chitin deacetylase (PgdA/CDA1 family)
MGGGSALILAYHAVERGLRPLCVEPKRFRDQLDALADAGARTLTLEQVAAGLSAGDLPDQAVAITFDDGFASVVEHAVPALLERGMRATIFCVAGHLGGANDWATQPEWAPRLPLAGAAQLAEVAALGFGIGSHGIEHLPLAVASGPELRREIVDSRAALEQALATPVPCFAYPYGAEPPASARPLLEGTYIAACGTRAGRARPGHDRFSLPRVDAHYVHRPALLRRAAAGMLDPYLGARRRAAAVRRRLRPDYAQKSIGARAVLSGR